MMAAPFKPQVQVTSSSSEQQEKEYEVDFVFGKMKDKKDKDIRYAVKWQGWDLNDMSWEPTANFVNNTALCVRRFERCQSYQQYFQEKKKTSTQGIRVHILGGFAQVYVPEVLHFKARPTSSYNTEVKPIVKNGDENKQFQSKNQMESKHEEGEPDNGSSLNDESGKQQEKFLGKFQAKNKDINSNKPKLPNQMKLEGSRSTKMYAKNNEDDAITLQNGGKNPLSSQQSFQPQKPVLPPSKKYQLLQPAQPLDNNGQPVSKERPKIKTERDYLNEIINAQRLKEQQAKLSVNASVNQSMQQSTGQTSFYNPQSRQQQLDSTQLNGHIKYQEPLVDRDTFASVKILESTRPEQISLDQMEDDEVLPIYIDAESQCDAIPSMNLEDHLYTILSKGARFIQLEKTKLGQNVELAGLKNHFLGQIDNDQVKLIFQVSLSQNNSQVFTTLEYLQENELELLIEYSLRNSVFY